MYFKNVCWKYAPRQDGTCSVKIYVNIEGMQRYYPVPGVFVQVKDFDEKRGYVKKTHPLCLSYNARIRHHRNEVESHFLNGGDFRTFGDPSNKPSLISYLKEYVELLNVSAGTLKVYKALENRLKEFAKQHNNGDLLFEDINSDFQYRYTKFMEEFAKKPTIGQHFSRIKTIMRTAQEAGKHNNEAYKQLPNYLEQRPEKIYLTRDEIKNIESLKLTPIPTLEVERDRFLICYYLLLRFSDLKRIRQSMLFEHNGQIFIRFSQKKTKSEAVIPIKREAKILLDKYNFDFSSANIKDANIRLKTIAAMANINELVGDPPQVKSQLVTTHTARRSAATNLYLEGASLKTIADIGGWSNTDMLRVYLKASKLDSAELAAKNLDFFKSG